MAANSAGRLYAEEFLIDSRGLQIAWKNRYSPLIRFNFNEETTENIGYSNPYHITISTNGYKKERRGIHG